MGWSELQLIPNEYNDKIKVIDEDLLKLMKERKSIAKGKRYFPPKEVLQDWSARFELDIAQINWFMHSLNDSSRPPMPNEPGELVGVLPLMKKSVADGFEYHLTHAMQHKNASIVFLEIKGLEHDDNVGHVRVHLLLEANGVEQYTVSRNGSHGGGGQAQVRFLVTPPLPENIEQVQFALTPFAVPMEDPPKDVVLDKEVAFD